MKIWFDTEFVEDGKTIDLISIGMVREDGKTLYLESADCNRSLASDWVKENVFPHLSGPLVSREHIASEVVKFAGTGPEFWAYYCSYDWVVLCQLFGTMMDLPDGWPMFCRDLQQVRSEAEIDVLPEMTGAAHNALADAVWTKAAHEFCIAHEEGS